MVAAARAGGATVCAWCRALQRRASSWRHPAAGRNMLGGGASPPHIIAIPSTLIVPHQTIVVLDFGSQYTQLIARRLRELSVYSEVLPFNTPIERLRREASPPASSCRAVPRACPTPMRPICDPAVVDLGVPVLGICYGMQLLTSMLGGEVRRSGHREFGHAQVQVRRRTRCRALFDGLPAAFTRVGEPRRRRGGGAARVSGRRDQRHGAHRGHGGRRIGASTACCSTPRWCTPSTAPTSCGNFAFDVCGCTGDWTIASFIEEATAADPARRSGPRQGRLRPVGRRRFDGGGHADPPGHRRPADLHLRGQRAAAPRGGQPDPTPLHASSCSCRWTSWTRATSS